MLFDEVVVHNFGVYAGRQSVCLAPPKKDKPVILLGGLNGGGKTTLLDAINLALYGKRARCSNRGELSYEDFLRRSIHRGVPRTEGASVSISFSNRFEGLTQSYRVSRSWTATESGARERLEVFKDGGLDRVLTETWSEHVEDFLPLGLSQLFLFDGEKIEAFADLQNSKDLLRTALNSLLGLETVDQLVTDLSIIERRRRGEVASPISPELGKAELAAELAANRVRELKTEEATVQNELTQRERALAQCEERYRKAGGQQFEQRAELEARQKAAEDALEEVEEELREVACGAAPFLVVPDLLGAVLRQDTLEHQAERAHEVDDLLVERDERVIHSLRALGVDPEVVARAEEMLARDRTLRKTESIVNAYLCLDQDARYTVQALEATLVPAAGTRARELIELAIEKRSILTDAERILEGVPTQEGIRSLQEEREMLKRQRNETEERQRNMKSQIAHAEGERDRLKERLTKLKQDHAESQIGSEDSARIVVHSRRVRETLARFKSAVLARHLGRIEQRVLQSLGRLLRKEKLISAIHIDPETLTLELTGMDGHNLTPERLSAGERQLLAVSLLWGLAQSAERALPAVIDTPLGRLDSTHRAKIVERYFPFASHQVLLLSTDEEVDAEHFAKLRPWIGHSYVLKHDEKLGRTAIERGYFWK